MDISCTWSFCCSCWISKRLYYLSVSKWNRVPRLVLLLPGEILLQTKIRTCLLHNCLTHFGVVPNIKRFIVFCRWQTKKISLIMSRRATGRGFLTGIRMSGIQFCPIYPAPAAYWGFMCFSPPLRDSLAAQLESSLTKADSEQLARSIAEEQYSLLEKEKIMKELEIKDMMARHKQELSEKEATISSVGYGHVACSLALIKFPVFNLL